MTQLSSDHGRSHGRSRSRCGARLVIAGLLAGPPLLAAQSAALETPELFQFYCFECHGDGSSKGSFELDALLAKGNDPELQGMWKKVWTNIRHEFMPPATAEYMFPDERREAARWIEHEIFGVDPDQIDPGVVTIRRLNREEYQNTVEDLFGAGLQLRELLLPDDTAYGFDNIGDAQTLSPVQFNRYLEIAEYIVNQIVLVDGPPLPRFEYDALGPYPEDGRSRKRVKEEDGVVEREFAVELPQDGRYRVELTFETGGWHDFGGDISAEVFVGDELAGGTIVPLGGEVETSEEWEIELKKGSYPVVFRSAKVPLDEAAKAAAEAAALAADLAAREADAAAGLSPEQIERRARRRQATPAKFEFDQLKVAVVGPLEGEVRAAYPEPHQRIFFRGHPPKDQDARREYAREILRRVADRAFHRPVDRPTLKRLTDLAMTDDNFERGIASGLTAILASPRFLFREEVQPQPNNPSARHLIDEYALASRLSYLLWVSIPDQELYDLAAAGELRDNLDDQVERMLADPKSKRFFRDFTGQWLRTRNVLMTAISRANDLNPVREEMKLETDAFFEYIARNDRDLIELIEADYTFLNEELAAYYGIDGVTGDSVRKVDLSPDARRGGVLTHGSFLVSTSNPDRTSPVKRGVYVLENLLGTPPPPPPAAVPPLEEAHKDGVELKTLRDQLAAHREDPACAACHAHFDPIGLALENFSHIGQWRDEDAGTTIDASGEMVTGEEFEDFAGLRDIIAQRKDKFYRCVTEKLMTYTLGRGLEPYDAATIDAITDRLLNNGGSFSTLLMSIIESPAFQMRRGDGHAQAVAMTGH